MFKTSYKTGIIGDSRDYTVFRGWLHGLTWIWFYMYNSYTVATCYFISFLYHKLAYFEEEFRLLDHLVIGYRLFSFVHPIYTQENVLSLLISTILIHNVLTFKNLWKCLKQIQVSRPFLWYANYAADSHLFELIHYSAPVLLIYGLYTNGLDTHIILSIFYSVPSILFFYLSIKMPWDSQGIWTSHDNFHLCIFVLDIVSTYLRIL